MKLFALATILVLTNILCLGLTLMVTQWLAEIKVITKFVIQIFLIILMNIGIVCTTTLFFAGVIKMRKDITTSQQQRRFKYVPYVGLYVFGIGSILLDLLEFSGILQCTGFLKNFTAQVTDTDLSTHLRTMTRTNDVFSAYYIFKSLSVILQLSFLVKYKDYRAVSSLSRLCVMVNMAAHSTLYMFTFLQETENKFQDGAPDIDDKLLHYALTVNNSQVAMCLNQNTSLLRTLRGAEPYFYPFDMEFSLMAAGMLITMLLSQTIDSMSQTALPEGNETDVNAELISTAERAEEESQEAGSENNTATDDDVPLLTAPGSDLRDDDGPSGTTDVTPSNVGVVDDSKQPTEGRTCIFAFNVAIVLSILLIVLEAICYDEQLHEALILYFYGARVTYYCILLTITVSGAVLIGKKFPLQSIQFGPEPVLLLIAAAGEFIYLYFGMLASSAAFSTDTMDLMMKESKNNTSPSPYPHEFPRATLVGICWLTLFTNLIDIFQNRHPDLYANLGEGSHLLGNKKPQT